MSSLHLKHSNFRTLKMQNRAHITAVILWWNKSTVHNLQNYENIGQ